MRCGASCVVAVAVHFFALWAPRELRTGAPLVDLRTSARRPVLLTNAASLLAGFAMFTNLLDGSLVELMVGVSVVSIGIAVSFAAMPVLIMQSVPINETAAANGLST